MKETATLKIKYSEGTDGADAPAITELMAKKIEELLLAIPATQIKGGADKNILVVQGTGAAAFKAMSGDITISNAGVTAIGALKVLTGMLADLAVTSGKLDNSSVLEGKIAALAVSAAKLAANAVETAKVKDLAVTEPKLGEEAVSTLKLNDLAVTAAKIAEATIVAAKIASNAIEAKHLIANAVETAKIKDAAVTTPKIADLGVTEPKVADGAVAAVKLKDLAVEEAKVKDGAITSRKFKPTVGIVRASADLALTTSYKSITGGLINITPLVASKLKIVATFDIDVSKNATGAAQGQGSLSVDGAAEEGEIAFLRTNLIGTHDIRSTVTQTYLLSLTAAEHTIQMRAKMGAENTAGFCYKTHTSMLYELVAA